MNTLSYCFLFSFQFLIGILKRVKDGTVCVSELLVSIPHRYSPPSPRLRRIETYFTKLYPPDRLIGNHR